MALTNAQLTTLAADIEADPALAAIPKTTDGAFAVAAEYNKLASPDFYVWRTDVPTSDVKKAIVWTEYVGASINAGDRDGFNLMISNGIVDASNVNVRAGIAEIFKNATGTRDALVAIAKRLAKRAEKLFATGGDGAQATPATMTFEGNLSHQHVEDAWRLSGAI